jgi:hypothetical protein
MTGMTTYKYSQRNKKYGVCKYMYTFFSIYKIKKRPSYPSFQSVTGQSPSFESYKSINIDLNFEFLRFYARRSTILWWKYKLAALQMDPQYILRTKNKLVGPTLNDIRAQCLPSKNNKTTGVYNGAKKTNTTLEKKNGI